VEKLEKQLASVKEAMDADLEAKAAEAEQLKGKVAELRNATSHTVADSEASITALQVPAHCTYFCVK
jgi:multidrug resistance efflux pump